MTQLQALCSVTAYQAKITSYSSTTMGTSLCILTAILSKNTPVKLLVRISRFSFLLQVYERAHNFWSAL